MATEWADGNPIPGVFAVDKAVYMELRSDPQALEQVLDDQPISGTAGNGR